MPLSTASPPPHPARIGRYAVVGPIARGGMAEVLHAVMEGPGGFRRQVALKRVLPSLGRDAEFVQLFEREARLAARLRHANVVQVLDYGADGDSHYLVMELIVGRDLRRVAEQSARLARPLPLGLAAFIGGEVLRGLAHAHDLVDEQGRPAGILHRDVSPHNVLVSFAGEVKLSDFGIAKALDATARTSRSVVRGKVSYMAPEQALAQPLDARADLFAVGVMLYELAARRRLWGSESSEAETYARLIRGRVAPPRTLNPEIPAALEELILRLLARDPAGRPPSAEQALRELCAIGLAPLTASLDLAAHLRSLFLADVAPPEGATASLRAPAPGGGRAPRPAAAASAGPTATYDGAETELLGEAHAARSGVSARRLSRWALRAILGAAVAGAATAIGLLAARAPTPSERAAALAPPSLPSVAAPAPSSGTRPPAAPAGTAVARSETVAATAVPLQVRVTPANARLFLDGAPVAGSSPYNLFVDANRAVALRASRPGYAEASIRLAPGQAAGPVNLRLERAAVSGETRAAMARPRAPAPPGGARAVDMHPEEATQSREELMSPSL